MRKNEMPIIPFHDSTCFVVPCHLFLSFYRIICVVIVKYEVVCIFV